MFILQSLHSFRLSISRSSSVGFHHNQTIARLAKNYLPSDTNTSSVNPIEHSQHLRSQRTIPNIKSGLLEHLALIRIDVMDDGKQSLSEQSQIVHEQVSNLQVHIDEFRKLSEDGRIGGTRRHWSDSDRDKIMDTTTSFETVKIHWTVRLDLEVQPILKAQWVSSNFSTY